MSKKRVLVVDDSVFMRRIVSDLVGEHPDFQVIATAKNGVEAVQLAKELQPDCITMDVEMPEMNGLEALKRIMEENPLPVIMLSSLTKEGAMVTIQALEAGAIDFVQKPSGSISLDLFKVKEMLHERLEIAVKSNIKRLKPAFPAAPPPANPAPPRMPPVKDPPPAPRARTVMPSAPAAEPARPLRPPPVQPERKPERSALRPQIKPVAPPAAPPVKPPAAPIARGPLQHLVALGTSTGGPRALQQVLGGLPEDFAAPIVIVQHMPPNFTNSLAVRLNSNCRIQVVEGQDGMVLQPGTAYIAPGGFQMRVVSESSGTYRLSVTAEPPRSGHKPSVDTLFESVVPLQELKRHIVIMTGMGSDGARTMLELKNRGAATTIAESEETCVVYGMPRAAVELGCVDHVLPVHEIPNQLIRALMK
ncbi:chemotaxis response regulator protein-glutamate methylesterase [Paenibacillus sp. YN15]|uniref:protein-glutamate methylesterase/protein-glutamine glutaminase n=1 Tax=Paenibacillus sp. YN15 TaxID=1742774 RepID=UPI000DCF10FB|nr:chemotaxis response regulator protein-glutamate methylesterase [Paenibacillus sp. YN15]RAV03530.1 chemotaxis response regulator protein-glutamate methylesterase [Paenibacillus sp. YN15]